MKRNKKIHDRVIVALLVEDGACVNHQSFKFHEYLGDVVNLVKIFCEKNVDELMIADRSAYEQGINYKLLERISSVCTVPLSYCGSIKSLSDATNVTQLGFEKVFLNNTFNPELALEISQTIGKSSLGRIIDYNRNVFGKYKQLLYSNDKLVNLEIDKVVEEIQRGEVGELILRNAKHDGLYKGFDLSLFNLLHQRLSIPLLLAGGASTLADIGTAYNNDASGCVVSSLFTFYGAEKGILPNYPTFEELEMLYEKSNDLR